MPSHNVVGAAEIAELLGISRQRVDQLTRRKDFPPPIIELTVGRIWLRTDVESWAAGTGRIGRGNRMTKFEYMVVPWKQLLIGGGASLYDSLEFRLNEQGSQGWRFDQRITLDYETQQVEYGLFVKEVDDAERDRLNRVGECVERVIPLIDRVERISPDQSEWQSAIALLRQALAGFAVDGLPYCWKLADDVGRHTDEHSTAGEARREVTAALAALANK